MGNSNLNNEEEFQEPENKMKGWAVKSEIESKSHDYQGLLTYAKDLYIQQTDWFLHHEQLTIRNLAAIITAEFAITGSVFALHKESMPYGIIASVALLILGFLSYKLGVFGIKSCQKAYMASLEYAMMKNKIAWILGFTTPIPVNSNGFDLRPVPEDVSLYVPRHLNRAFKTTKEYVGVVLEKKDHTFFHAKKKIWYFRTLGLILGLGASLLISIFIVI